MQILVEISQNMSKKAPDTCANSLTIRCIHHQTRTQSTWGHSRLTVNIHFISSSTNARPQIDDKFIHFFWFWTFTRLLGLDSDLVKLKSGCQSHVIGVLRCVTNQECFPGVICCEETYSRGRGEPTCSYNHLQVAGKKHLMHGSSGRLGTGERLLGH